MPPSLLITKEYHKKKSTQSTALPPNTPIKSMRQLMNQPSKLFNSITRIFCFKI